MIKTSPRMMIGYGGETGQAASPSKTLSDANFSVEAAQVR